MKKIVLLLCVMISSISSFADGTYTYNADTKTWSPELTNINDVKELIVNANQSTSIDEQYHVPTSNGQYKMEQFPNIEKLTVNGGIVHAFSNMNKLTSAVFNRCTIKGGSFNNCPKVTSIEVNGGTIESQGFSGMSNLKTIYINYVNSIASQAFANLGHVSDVYVAGDVKCCGHAFEYTMTVSQTNDSQLEGLATLHYDKQYYDKYEKPKVDYINQELKKGRTLQSILSTIQGGGVFNNDYAGWNEFMNSGNDVIKANTFRSYSDRNARIVPADGMVYLVHKIWSSGDDNKSKTYILGLVPLKANDVIPANTGVLIYSKNTYYLQPTTTKESAYDQSRTSSDPKFNYLMPQTEADSMRLCCVNRDDIGNITYRNFVLGRYSQTTVYDGTSKDYYSFWRLISGFYKYGYAYLHLPKDVYPTSCGYECAFGKYTDADNNEEDYTEFSSTGNITLMAKGMVILTDEDLEAEKDATSGIQTVETKTDASANGKYYNLMGVEVENPTQGIYIHNGKKVYIK